MKLLCVSATEYSCASNHVLFLKGSVLELCNYSEEDGAWHGVSLGK